MNMHPLSLAAAAEGLNNLSPDRTYCSKLRNLHEEISAHGEAEHNLACSLIGSKTTLHHSTHIICCNIQAVSNLLNIISTATAEDIASDHDGLKLWSILNGPLCSLISLVVQLSQGLSILAMLNKLTHWICTNEALKNPGILAISLKCTSS